MLLKSLKSLLVLLVISACTSTPLPPEIRIVEVPVAVEYEHPSKPSPVTLNKVNWVLIQLENGDYSAVPLEEYQLIIENMQTINTYVGELQAIINYYRNVTNANEE